MRKINIDKLVNEAAPDTSVVDSSLIDSSIKELGEQIMASKTEKDFSAFEDIDLDKRSGKRQKYMFSLAAAVVLVATLGAFLIFNNQSQTTEFATEKPESTTPVARPKRDSKYIFIASDIVLEADQIELEFLDESRTIEPPVGSIGSEGSSSRDYVQLSVEQATAKNGNCEWNTLVTGYLCNETDIPASAQENDDLACSYNTVVTGYVCPGASFESPSAEGLVTSFRMDWLDRTDTLGINFDFDTDGTDWWVNKIEVFDETNLYEEESQTVWFKSRIGKSFVDNESNGILISLVSDANTKVNLNIKGLKLSTLAVGKSTNEFEIPQSTGTTQTTSRNNSEDISTTTDGTELTVRLENINTDVLNEKWDAFWLEFSTAAANGDREAMETMTIGCEQSYTGDSLGILKLVCKDDIADGYFWDAEAFARPDTTYVWTTDGINEFIVTTKSSSIQDALGRPYIREFSYTEVDDDRNSLTTARFDYVDGDYKFVAVGSTESVQ